MALIGRTGLAGAALTMIAMPSLALGPMRVEATATAIVEIQNVGTLESYVCGACVPSDLAAAVLPAGFTRSPPRRILADFGEVRRVPSDPDYVGVDVAGLEFQRVARAYGGFGGVQPVGPGTMIQLESDRTLRFDGGREVHTLSDGHHAYVLYVVADGFDLATLAMPAGWTRSSRIVDRDLVIFDPTGLPFVYMDAQGSLWQRFTIPAEAQIASPHRLAGTRLDLSDRAGAVAKRRLVVRLRREGSSRAPSGTAEDPTVAGGWMIVRNDRTGEEDTFDLPASHWRGIGQPAGARGWRYRDRRRENGPCPKVSVKRDGAVAAVCAGADVGLTVDEAVGGPITVGLAFGPTVTYCATFGGTIRHDFGTSERRSGRGRFLARGAAAPDVCPLRPVYRVPIRWEEDVPVRALELRGRDVDAPLLGDLGAVNIHTVQDAVADAAYSARVIPLISSIGATLVVLANDPTFVDTTNGPAAWAQPHLAMPSYPGAPGILGMVTSPEWGALNDLKAAQVGDSLHFGLQRCLHDCDAFLGPLLPPRLFGRILAIHYTAPRAAIERTVPALAAEAAATAGIRLGWAGRTVADVLSVLDSGALMPGSNPLGADGSLLYVLDDGIAPADVLALPELAAFLAQTGEHTVAFFGP